MDEPILPAPADVNIPEWNVFSIAAIALLIVIIGVVFYWYKSSYHRRMTIKRPEDIFRQQRPWIETFWYTLLLGFVLTFAVGLIVVSDHNGDVILSEFVISLAVGVLAMFLYWLLCLMVGLPVRVKYVPFGKKAGRHP